MLGLAPASSRTFTTSTHPLCAAIFSAVPFRYGRMLPTRTWFTLHPLLKKIQQQRYVTNPENLDSYTLVLMAMQW